MKQKRIAGLAAIAVTCGLAMAPVAFGDDTDADTQLQDLSVELKQLEVADKDHVATEQLGKAEALRDKARTLIGDRKGEQSLAWTLEELEATVALIDAKIDKHDAEEKFAEQKAALDTKKSEITELKGETESLEAERTKLEKQLAGGQ